MANLVEKAGFGLDWRFSRQGILQSAQEGQRADQWPEVRSLKIPTLVVKGEKSQYMPIEVYEKVLQSNPVIQGVIVPGAGHWVHAERPQQFIEILRQFAGLF